MTQMTSTTRLLEAIARVQEAAGEAQRALGDGIASTEVARERLTADLPVSAIVTDLIAQGGRDARLRASTAIEAYEHAVMVYRADLVRAMVDEERLNFAQVGRVLGVSRQMVARLYRSGDRPAHSETT